MKKRGRSKSRLKSHSKLKYWLEHSCGKSYRLFVRNPRFSGLLTSTLILLLFIAFAMLLPSEQPFEGSLTFNSLSFESTKKQPFLRDLQSLDQLSIIGQPNFEITGNFSDLDLLEARSRIALTANNEDSIFQITKNTGASLEVSELLLEPGTQIQNLRYDDYNKRLSFDILGKTASQLIVNAGGTIQTSLVGYKIASLKNDVDNVDFSWAPDNQLVVRLPKQLSVELKLGDFSEYPFWGNLAVTDVSMEKAQADSLNVSNTYLESSVLLGNIRLGSEQSYLVEPNQFVRFHPGNAVNKLFRLGLSSPQVKVFIDESQSFSTERSEPGIKADVFGATRTIDIGFNPKFPIAQLQASFLEAWMPRDAVIGLIAFLSTLVMTLIGWLWEIATEEPE